MRQHVYVATRCTIAATLCVFLAGCGQGSATEPGLPAGAAKSTGSTVSSVSNSNSSSEGRGASQPDRSDISAGSSVEAAAGTIGDNGIADSQGADNTTADTDTSRGNVSDAPDSPDPGEQTENVESTDSGTAPDNVGDGSTDAHNLVQIDTI